MKILQVNIGYFKLPEDFTGDTDTAYRLLANHLLTPKKYEELTHGLTKDTPNEEALQILMKADDIQYMSRAIIREVE